MWLSVCLHSISDGKEGNRLNGGLVVRVEKMLVLLLCMVFMAFGAEYVIWQDALKKNYSISDSPGPNINISRSNIFEGTLFSVTEDDANHFKFFHLRAFMNPYACVVSKDLNFLRGTLTSAKLRGEYLNRVNANMVGNIVVERGVLDFNRYDAGPITRYNQFCVYPDTAWDRISDVRNSAFLTNICKDTIVVRGVQGRIDATSPSPLVGKFWEVDLTPQVQWILDNNDSLKTKLWTIYFNRPVFSDWPRDSGRVELYSFTNCDSMPSAYAYPGTWTKDGNSLHLVIEGELWYGTSKKEDKKAITEKMFLNSCPNPINNQLTISCNVPAGEFDRATAVRIRDVSGKTVWSGTIRGGEFRSVNFEKRPAGVYLVEAKEGGRTFTKRVLCVR